MKEQIIRGNNIGHGSLRIPGATAAELALTSQPRCGKGTGCFVRGEEVVEQRLLIRSQTTRRVRRSFHRTQAGTLNTVHIALGRRAARDRKEAVSTSLTEAEGETPSLRPTAESKDGAKLTVLGGDAYATGAWAFCVGCHGLT
jgi:hypothetical protein